MERKKMTIILIAFILVVIVAAYYMETNRKSKQAPEQPATDNAAPDQTVKYINSDYGFEFDLPAGWKGYSVVVEKWESYIYSDAGQTLVAEGPQISIRHPQWTEQAPRQDIPIMIFTISQWNDMQADKFHIGAAPINPSELGRNDKFVFALPARYNFAFLPGYEEVEKILEGNPLRAL